MIELISYNHNVRNLKNSQLFIKTIKKMSLLPLLLLCLSISMGHSQTYTILSETYNLGEYSYFTVTLHSHMLPKNDNFTLSIQESDSAVNSTYVAVGKTSVYYELGHRYFQIWNYQNLPKVISVSLKADVNLTVSSLALLFGENQQKNMFTAIVNDALTSGYMLPFNMLDVKVSEVFMVSKNAGLTASSYSLPPFMSTYWTQNKIIASAMPWLPFFSQCTYEQPNIILNSVLLPSNCQTDVYQDITCQDKTLQFSCMIEEYELTNVYQQYWFNAIKKILYFISPRQLSPEAVDSLRSSSQAVFSDLFDHFSCQLIPVIYQRQSPDAINVNVFNLTFQVDLNKGKFTQLISAKIIGSYDQTVISPYGQVTIEVEYLNQWEVFIYYSSSYSIYAASMILFALILAVMLSCLQTKISGEPLTGKLKFMISPAMKGTAYTLMTAGVAAMLIHMFSFYTNYSGLLATYDADYSGQSLRSNNKGRYGLALLYTGILIVMTGIKQAFKVNETEQLKLALQDDKWHFDSEEELDKKIDFSKKNQISHRRYIFNGFLIALIYSLLIFFAIYSKGSNMTALFLFVFPFFNKVLLHLLKRYLIKSHIFICALMLSLQLLPCYLILKNTNYYELIYLYISKYLSFYVIEVFLEIAINSLCRRLQSTKEDNKVSRVLYDIFESDIVIRNNQTQYEKALSYSMLTVSLVSSIFLYPVLAIFMYYTQQNTEMSSIFMITQHSLILPALLFIAIAPVELYTVMLLIEFLKKYQGLRIEETVRFNHFKFMRVKFRWMNDVFAHSKQIREEYRQYQKFAFSSQLYFVITIIAVGMQLALVGTITMVYISYLPFYDPITYPLFIFIWVIIEILSVVVSFLAVKLKLYQKKQADPIRQKLGKSQKYLKITQSQPYLCLDAVKDYFMLFNKTWIIHNLHNIFTKQDFRQNNGALFNKYKQYKSNFKRRQIQQKKKIKEMKLEESNLEKQELFARPYLVFRNKQTFHTSKRISMYWYYLAKQNLYMKAIVNCVKKEQMQPICQFCKMDVQLQVLEKKEFRELVNLFRVENVGRMFSQASFLQYYRLNQQFITICSQCKEHNLHLQSRISSKSKQAKIVFCWLLMARSRLLHKQHHKEYHLQ